MKTNADNKQVRLGTQIALALTLGTAFVPSTALAAPITASQTYTADVTVTDDVDIADGTITVEGVDQDDPPSQHANHTAVLKGNVKIKKSSGNILAALSHGDGTQDWTGILTINPDRTSKVELRGDILVGRPDNSYEKGGYVNLYLKGAESYFAGGITDLDGKALHQRGGVRLELSDGATWYPKGGSYELAAPSDLGETRTGGTWTEDQNKPRGLHLSADSGVIDIAFAAPNERRPNTVPAGERTLTFNNTRTALNGATFRISTNLTENKADKVVLNGVTEAGNQYKLQVAFDPKMNDAVDKTNYVIAPTVAGGIEVLNSSKGSDTVTAREYTTQKAVAAGLLTKAFKVKPTLSESTDGAGRKIVRVTKIEVTDADANPTPPTPQPQPPTPQPPQPPQPPTPQPPIPQPPPPGPALRTADLLMDMALAHLSAWRGENNDLHRRMGARLRRQERVRQLPYDGALQRRTARH